MDMLMTSLGKGTQTVEMIVALRLIIAALCGGFLGAERLIKGRPAGLKTFSLVCMGAALVMSTNEYLFLYISQGVGDIVRLAAQVISGIGFLGAGTIIVTGSNQIKGLTTAAALWVAATIGIAIGAGFYFGGIAATLLVFIMSRLFSIFDKQITERSKYMTILVELSDEETLLEIMELLNKKDLLIKSLTRKTEGKWYKEDISVIIDIDFGRRCDHTELLKELQKKDGVRFAVEL